MSGWHDTGLEQIIHYRREGHEFAACGVYAAAMTADTYHAVTPHWDTVTCGDCRTARAREEESPLDAIKRGAQQVAREREAGQ